MVFRLIYLSTASKDISTEVLKEIFDRARENNQRDGITGLTAFHRFSFIQVLEGPKPAVKACFDRIKVNPHHHGITIVWEDDGTERLFEDYAMAYVEVSDAEKKRFARNKDLRDLFDASLAERISQDLATQSYFSTFLDSDR